MPLAASFKLSPALLRDLAPLREALNRRGTVMPVVGAGLSIPLRPCPPQHRLPTWKGLLEELIAKAPEAAKAKLAAMLAGGQMPLVASELVHHLDRGTISTYIEQRFARPRFDRPLVYDALVALPIDHFVTTNYDPFLQDAWAARHATAPNVVTPRDAGALSNLRFDARPFILMLHGTASRPQTCVLSAEEFDGLQFGTLGYAQALQALTMQRRLLFVGHSLSDPDLSAILRECRAFAGERAELVHWFLGVDIDDVQRRYLASHGVQAIEIATGGQYEVLEVVLRELSDPIKPELVPVAAASAELSVKAPAIPEGGPFPGLLPFDEPGERYFCGRETETLEVLGFLRNPPANSVRWVQIEGASGAGKSSLLRAGIVPPVRRGEVDGCPGGWRVAVIKPGRRPLRALATGLYVALEEKALTIDQIEKDLREHAGRIPTMLEEEKRLPNGVRIVLAIDQFEELFTFVNPDSPAEVIDRQRFGERLAEALGPGCPRFHLLTTVRRDYLEHFSMLPELDRALGGARRLNVPLMDRETLARSIEESARRAGLRWDPPSLSAAIADDASAQSGGLASVGLLLTEMWQRQERRGDGTLLQRDYEDLHKVAGVLALRADELLARLGTRRVSGKTWGEGALAMLVAMVRRDPSGFDRRKPISRDEAIRYAGGEALGEHVLEALSGLRPHAWDGDWPLAPRLVVVRDDAQASEQQAEPLVEVVHERLSRTWPTLDAAVAKEAEKLVWRDRLETQALAWHDAGMRIEDVVTGPTLKVLAASGSEHPHARSYLAAASLKERRQRRMRQARIGLAIVVAVGLLVSAASLKLFAERREVRASEADAAIAISLESWSRRWTDNYKEWGLELLGLARTAQDPRAAIERWRVRAEQRLAELERWLPRVVELEATEDLRSRDAGKLENARRLREAARAGRAQAESSFAVALHIVDSLEGGIAPYGRSEQQRRWSEVLASIRADSATHPYGGLELRPRFDLLPLRQRSSERPNERVWEFLVLGTGVEPVRDSEQAPWRVEPDSGVVVVLIPGGEFVMGAQSTNPDGPNFDEVGAEEDERPHLVRLSPFYIATHELTQGQWKRTLESVGLQAETPVDGTLPAQARWQDAADWCTLHGGGLPTEAQWEYACRAGTTTRFWGGDTAEDLKRVGWFKGNSDQRHHRVGEKLTAANPWGLFDMHGNKSEWCADWFGPYGTGPVVDPLGATSGSERAVRGGEANDESERCRSSHRWSLDPDLTLGVYLQFGVRLVLPVAMRERTNSIFDP